MINSSVGTSVKTDLNFKHLQAELTRIDVLIHREVRRWQLAGQDFTDSFRGQYISDVEANGLLQRPLATSWGQTITLKPEEEKIYLDALLKAKEKAQAVIAEADNQGHTLRLTQLATAFGLDQFEIDALLICLAPAFDLRYERLYGYLQDDVTRKYPNINLILNLLCEPGPKRLLMLARFAEDAPLIKYKLLDRFAERAAGKMSSLTQTMTVDETVIAWLLGRYQPHSKLGAHAILWQPQADAIDHLLGDVWPNVEPPLEDQPILAFYGPDNVRQEVMAKRLAVKVDRPLLMVDFAAVTAGDVSALEALEITLRDARLTEAIPCLIGWDSCLKEDKISPDLLRVLCAYADIVIIMGQTFWHPEGVDRERNFYWVEFPVPSYTERKALWVHFLDKIVLSEALNLDDISGQFALTTGQIRDIVASAKDVAVGNNRPVQSEDIFAAIRSHSSSNLAKLARKIEPRYSWADIILPPDQVSILQEIVATVRGRPTVLETWQVGQKLASSAGVTVLFAGSPGTGKTMGAELVASELKLDLYKIDLSTVISKYIGETEKNLEKIFQEAERSNAILFFDEADAIFGKRSEVRDAHDRYANIEVSYLLQRMEAYDGVTILATNLRANLDDAFIRRLQFVVEFPFPEEAAERLRIWQALFPATVPRSADVDLEVMARRFKLAGGNIRNIIVGAAFLAAANGGQVTMTHLLHGARREMQKMGRLIKETDLKI